MSLRAFARGKPNNFWNTCTTYSIRLIGSSHTITTHGTSRLVSVPPSSSSTVSGTTISSVPISAFATSHLGADFRRDPREEPVDEATGILGGILLGELDRLGDRDRGRHVGKPPELERTETQQRAIHDRHPFQRPVLGELPDDGVDLLVVL